MIDLSAIRAAAVFEGLRDEDLDDLGTIARERKVWRSERLFARDEQATYFYVGTRGQFALTVPVRVLGGQEEIAVEEKGPLDAFGWSMLVKPRRYIYSAYCTENGAVVGFERDELEALMERNERLGERLACNIAELIGKRARVLQDLWAEEVEQRIERVQYWKSREISAHWRAAVNHTGRRQVWTWISRHGTRFLHRSGRDPSAPRGNDLH